MQKITRLIKINDKMHHCASVYVHSECETYITFYTGPECQDAQNVVVLKYVDNEIVSRLSLGEKTGNPIIFGKDGKIFLIYSKFTDVDENGHKVKYGMNFVQRWKYCQNYICELSENLIIKSVQLIPGCFGRLARCQPLNVRGRLFIPLYRESDPISEIWELIDDNLKYVSSFGHVDENIIKYMDEYDLEYNYLGKGIAIQPTLFMFNDVMFAYCRNVSKSMSGKPVNALIFMNKNFDDWNWNFVKSDVPNYNSSIFIIDINKYHYMLYNDDSRRSKILMSNASNNFTINIAHGMYRRQSFSYPNASFAFDKLHVVHTNCGCIAWHIMDKEFIDATFSIGD